VADLVTACVGDADPVGSVELAAAEGEADVDADRRGAEGLLRDADRVVGAVKDMLELRLLTEIPRPACVTLRSSTDMEFDFDRDVVNESVTVALR
jgi:hypothetical protein